MSTMDNKQLTNDNNQVLSTLVQDDLTEKPNTDLQSPDLQQFFDFDVNQVNYSNNDSTANLTEGQLSNSSSVPQQFNFEELLNNSDLNSVSLLNNSDQSKQTFESQKSINDFQGNQFPDIFQFDWQDQNQGQEEAEKSAKVEQNQDLWDELFRIIN